MIKGIDVSSYQSNDYSTDGLDFVFIKVSEGTNYVNPRLEAQVRTARKAGLVVGFYHFQRHGDAVAEAAYFTEKVKPYLTQGDIIALDWEEHGLTTGDKDAWLKGVKASHPTHKVILYAYTSMWTGVDTDSFVQDGLWISDPNHPAGKPGIKHSWVFHQYSSSGGVDHNVGNFDTRDALRGWCIEDVPEHPAPSPKPTPIYAPFPGASFFKLGRKSPLVAAMGKRLVAEGYKGYAVGPSEEFSRADLKAYSWWQRKGGYHGPEADGYPGATTWAKLKVPKS